MDTSKFLNSLKKKVSAIVDEAKTQLNNFEADLAKMNQLSPEELDNLFMEANDLLEQGNFQAGIDKLTRAADGGHAFAMACLASFYLEGEIVPKDTQKARYYAQKSANMGAHPGQLWYGQILREEGQLTEALSWLEKSANQGNPMAMYYTGEMYENGEGTPKNLDKAIYWYAECAKTPYEASAQAVEALYRLGEKAYGSNEYMRLVLQCNVDKSLGADKLYEIGRDWDIDPTPERMAHLRAAGELHHVRAMVLLTNFFATRRARVYGLCTDENIKALYHQHMSVLLEEAKKGDEEATFQLAWIYRDGVSLPSGELFIEPDEEAAYELFETAAGWGHAYACYEYAKHLWENDQKERALDYFQSGAEHGNAQCAYFAGLMYENLDKPDLKQALYWYEKSAAVENHEYSEQAAEAVERLRNAS